MATNFPTALDTFTNPSSSDYLDTPGVLHDEQHANANDAIEALEAKVGINSSGDTNSIDYKLKNPRTDFIELVCAQDQTVHRFRVVKEGSAYVFTEVDS